MGWAREWERVVCRGEDGKGGGEGAGGAEEGFRESEREASHLRAPLVDTGSADWRDFRAALVSSEHRGAAAEAAEAAELLGDVDAERGAEAPWEGPVVLPTSSGARHFVHELGRPEPGCLLIANEVMPGLFWQTVIFMLEHSDTGSLGLVLNRPTNVTVKDLLAGGPSASMMKAFADEPVYMGGPVGSDQLLVLHPYANVKGATRVMEGAYFGGLEGAQDLVERGEANPREFKFFVGYSGWAAGQLEGEIDDRASWYVAAASSDVVMPHCIQLPVPLWRQVLGSMGGDYARLAREHDEWAGPPPS